MPFKHLHYLCAFILISVICCQCASPKPLAGGPKDETPPTVIEAESTPNHQTNFNSDQIVLVFDEWIVLKDVYSQLVISPPMPDEPEITQKGKSVIIDLPDSLRDETTYTINFGNSLTDLNEGNPLDNYVFVFSTGSVLDSNKISGSVIDAFTLSPVDDVWIMLYFTGNDSAVYNSRPDYISRTNEQGEWSVGFLPLDSFNVVALKDENLNFLYDQEGELFGYVDTTIYTGDGNQLPPISIFPREGRIIITDAIHTAPGWIKLVIDAPIPKPLPTFDPELENISTWQGDTLHVFYNPETNYTGYVILNDDSTRIRASTATNLLTQELSLRQLSGRIKPSGTAVFTTSIPIQTIEENLIQVQHDSLGNIPIVITRDSIDNRQFSVTGTWIGNNRYPIVFMPGAITDYWGRQNDTIRHSIVAINEDQFGDLFLSVEGLDSTKQYVILLKEGDQTRHTFVVSDKNDVRLVQKGMVPAKYKVEVFEDLNRNKVWDTGNFNLRRQPEKKMIFTPEALRAGWEQEIKLTWTR